MVAAALNMVNLSTAVFPQFSVPPEQTSFWNVQRPSGAVGSCLVSHLMQNLVCPLNYACAHVHRFEDIKDTIITMQYKTRDKVIENNY